MKGTAPVCVSNWWLLWPIHSLRLAKDTENTTTSSCIASPLASDTLKFSAVYFLLTSLIQTSNSRPSRPFANMNVSHPQSPISPTSFRQRTLLHRLTLDLARILHMALNFPNIRVSLARTAHPNATELSPQHPSLSMSRARSSHLP